MMENIIGYGVACLIGFAIGFGLLWARNRDLERTNSRLENIDARFGEISQNALRQSNEQFLQLAHEKLKQAQNEGQNDLAKREDAIKNLVDPMNKALQSLDEKIQNLEKTRVSA